MQLEHSFTVPVGVDEAFTVLRDIERIAPCMPGATITSVDGDTFSGKVKVKVGPMQITYQGDAEFVEVDEATRSATIRARGKEARGAGTANATIRASCIDVGGRTEVNVVTDLLVTGRPAQFGRGVMADVGDKLLGRFAECLAEKLSGEEEPAAPAPAAAREAPAGPAPGERPAEKPPAAAASGPPEPAGDNVIDLFDVAGGAVARRAAPVAALVLLALIIWLVRRR